ncbi:MAG: hypothetical protein M0D54_01930 [Hyphomonadaceae bacterium JAD_PAG50586_4]|nr:MAG: hypothetical protein M0D54_01930 [Hyphomonadaceae bacterium JAD_PAG50586_4]
MEKEYLAAFAAAFDDAADTRPDLQSCYVNSSSWTAFMLGAEPEGVLRGAARRWADACGYGGGASSAHAQWYTLDFCVVAPGYEGDGDYWKSRTILAVEHENGSDVETEMWKLAHWRSDLSVLVFYDFAEDDQRANKSASDKWMPGVTTRNWLEEKCRRLTAIVRTVDPGGNTRRLLLIGQKASGPVTQILWRAALWEGDSFSAPRSLKMFLA